jgi:hypothetical protein
MPTNEVSSIKKQREEPLHSSLDAQERRNIMTNKVAYKLTPSNEQGKYWVQTKVERREITPHVISLYPLNEDKTVIGAGEWNEDATEWLPFLCKEDNQLCGWTILAKESIIREEGEQFDDWSKFEKEPIIIYCDKDLPIHLPLAVETPTCRQYYDIEQIVAYTKRTISFQYYDCYEFNTGAYVHKNWIKTKEAREQIERHCSAKKKERLARQEREYRQQLLDEIEIYTDINGHKRVNIGNESYPLEVPTGKNTHNTVGDSHSGYSSHDPLLNAWLHAAKQVGVPARYSWSGIMSVLGDHAGVGIPWTSKPRDHKREESNVG